MIASPAAGRYDLLARERYAVSSYPLTGAMLMAAHLPLIARF